MCDTSDQVVWDLAGIPIVVGNPGPHKMPGFHHYGDPRYAPYRQTRRFARERVRLRRLTRPARWVTATATQASNIRSFPDPNHSIESKCSDMNRSIPDSSHSSDSFQNTSVRVQPIKCLLLHLVKCNQNWCFGKDIDRISSIS